MDSEQEDFAKNLNVSYETIHRLKIYRDMLVEWNQKFNLISESTIPQIWTRHFADCAQLWSYIPKSAASLADMGAGAGFPGLVLAIMALGVGHALHVTEIEATNKKADFLQAVTDELKLPVTVRRERVENINDFKADIVTARALKALPDLLKYANYLIHTDSVCLFPKGRAAADELTAARKYWTFDVDLHPSRSDETGQILVLRQLRYKTRR
jgi:16S rRNA (guanine527-N7)-methyltransferase